MEVSEKIRLQKTLVERYKILLQESKVDEGFKLDSIVNFQKNWDLESPDFYKMFNLAFKGRKHLFYELAWGTINKAAQHFPKKVREMFTGLYDENIDLGQRILNFQQAAENLVPTIKEVLGKEKLNHFQDERTISVYLTLRFPEKYYFYKDSYYQEYCSLIQEKAESTGNKYHHFLTLAEDFKKNVVIQDKALFELHRKQVQNIEWDDTNVLVQSILYLTLEQHKENGGGNAKYWIFQGDPEQFDAVMALRDGKLDSWTAKAHKNEIKPGDKVILWMTGEDAGCYALATVKSAAKVIDNSSNLQYWLSFPSEEAQERIELKVDLNAWSTPLLKDEISGLAVFRNFKAGNQGTNFAATKEQFEMIFQLLMEKEPIDRHYWLYAPGDKAVFWEEFYNKGIMAIGWDELGNLSEYQTKAQIVQKLQEIENTTSSKKNDATACYEFVNLVKPRDIIIAKKGRSDYLGYGVVTSDFYFDPSHKMPNQRKIEWKKKGVWTENGKIVLKTLTDITKYPDYVKKLIHLLGIEEDKTRNMLACPLNTILYGPPGTGKTYSTIDRAMQILTNSKLDHKANKKEFDRLRQEGQIEFITFHQNYAYEDFVIGLRPDTDGEILRFADHKGIFYQLCEKARKNWEASQLNGSSVTSFEEALSQFIQQLDEKGEIQLQTKKGKPFWVTDFSDKSLRLRKSTGSEQHTLSIATLKEVAEGKRFMVEGLSVYYNPLIEHINANRNNSKSPVPLKRYILIIDEINRANISKVFGELITLLEEDKRLGGENEMKVTLPNGEINFGVPPNLYILGTMNTADKSIALLDLALRRRFDFIGLYPEYNDLLPGISEKLRRLNEAILEAKKSPDFMIGHAFFIHKPESEFSTIMNQKVIPLLYEYFNSRAGFVKDLLDKAGISVYQDQNSFLWRVEES